MKTIGSVLQEYRQKHHLSVAELARRTSIAEEFVDAIEQEDKSRLPAMSLVQGYIRLIAAEIGLPEETALALFRRDLQTKSEQKIPLRQHKRWRFFFTPRLLSLSLFWGSILVAALWLLFHWQQIVRPPQLSVSAPKNYDIVHSPLTVNGQTDPEISLTINTEVISLDPQGRFSHELTLPPGERTVVIQATDRRGRTSEAIIFVTVE